MDVDRSIAYSVALLTQDLAASGTDADAADELFAQLGWNLQTLPGFPRAQLNTALSAISMSLDDLATISAGQSQDISSVVQVLSACASLAGQVAALPSVWASRPSGAAEWDAVGEDVLKWSLANYLAVHSPFVRAALVLLDFLDTADVVGPHPPSGLRGAWAVDQLALERVDAFMADPPAYLRQVYVGAPARTPAEVAARLLPKLGALLWAFGLRNAFDSVSAVLSVEIPADGGGAPLILSVSVTDEVDGPAVRIGASGEATYAVPLGVLQLLIGWAGTGEIVLGSTVAGAIDAEASLGIAYGAPDDGSPQVVIGGTDGTRVSLDSVGATVRARMQDGSVDYAVVLNVDELRVVVDFAELDSFVGESAGAAGLDASVSARVTFDASGVTFEGSGALELALPLRVELGPLRFDMLRVAAIVDGARLDTRASVDVSLTLGPVFASVQDLGVRALLEFASGNVGPANAIIEFAPPRGVGLAIDAGPVSGGGYLGFFPEVGRYTGVAQLDVVGIAVRAIGIVDTVLPGGEQGFSFLVLITAEFTPIQLGMGFTLNGIGGLAGIHRTLMTEPLRTGVREGTLDDILFPEDPVRDANALIARLQSIFPVKKDEYVFGVMVKLGYGTPSLVTAEIGLILKVPDPIIVLLGSISAKLPTEDAAVIDLNLDVLGILDFGQKLFSLDASLRDSRIAIFNISGDMALRLGWGDPPAFALSIGGLHPAFQPPPGFPTLRRVSISVGNGDNPRLGFEAYIALTSNSLQFGARVFLYAEAGGFSIEGYLGFDALIIFVPFSFRFDFAAGLIIKAGGTTLLSITVEGMLEGPTPWHVRGRASFCILFFEISVDFDARFGEEQQNTLPGVARDALLGQVRDAFEDAGNWSAALPEGEPSFVSFLEAPVPEGVVRIDPIGTLTARQKVAPLNRALSKVGESRVTDGPMTIGVPSTWLGGVSNASPDTVLEYFAPAQVEDLDDAAKLSRPSFEQMDGGVSFGVDEVAIGPGQTKTMEFETVRTDGAPPAFLYSPSVVTMLSQVRRGARPKAPATQSGLAKFAAAKGTPPLVAWRGDGEYVIANVDTLARRNDILPTPTTQGAASSRLASHLAANPSDRGTMQVVPLHEAA